MAQRILVTGGAGFIGSHLVDHLAASGHEVVVLDNFATGSRANLAGTSSGERLRIVEGSILDERAVAEAMAGCTMVFHLAVECVRRSIGDPVANHHVNATGTLTVLEAARRAKVGRFVYCSSSEVYGNSPDRVLEEDRSPCEPTTVYGGAKLAGELYTKAYLRTYGLDTVVVRPFNAYGPREHHQGDIAEVVPRFLIRVLNGLPPVVFGDGSQTRDFTYVTDTARGLAAAGFAADSVGKVVNIAYGRAVSIREVAEAVLRVCQRPDLAPVFQGERPGDVHHLHADTSRARALLGYQAETAFEVGLERYADWFCRQHPDVAALLEPEVVNWVLPH